jgi:hypothetical protein
MQAGGNASLGRFKARGRRVDEHRGGDPEATMRARGAGVLAVVASLLAGAALADPPPAPKPAPACEADRPEREARNLESLVESLESLERSQPPGPDQVIPLDNRGYNYGEPAFPLADLSRGPQR